MVLSAPPAERPEAPAAFERVWTRVASSVRHGVVPAGRKVSFQAMGTACQVVFGAPTQAAGDAFVSAAVRWLAQFEARYSRFVPESLVSRINAGAGRTAVELGPESAHLLALCGQLVFVTGGAFDPTSLPLVELWDWKRGQVPSDAQVREAHARVGWGKVQLEPGRVFLTEPGMGLDLGGMGKEYAVDRLVQLAQAHGIGSALVDLGQDLRALGRPADKPAWHIGLEDPRQAGSCWTGVAALDRAVATSGDYLRRFEAGGRRYGHILDPRTGCPVCNGCLAVSVLAPECLLAGILSTSAFILGPREGMALIERHYDTAGCIITENQHYESRQFRQYATR
jgi:thiamine biosynthesis lipoprotein